MPGSEAMAVGARRRARCVLGIALLGCGAVAICGREAAAYLYQMHWIRDDPQAICEALFQGPDSARGRAARELLRAREWEGLFDREVVGKEWTTRQVTDHRNILGPRIIERKLYIARDRDEYRIREHVSGGWQASRRHSSEEERSARVWGPFLLDLEDPGRVITWGVLDGKLVLGAYVRITTRDWVCLQSSSVQGTAVYTFLGLSFDKDLEPGVEGLCAWKGAQNSRIPLLLSHAPRGIFPGWGGTPYVVREEPRAHDGRVFVDASKIPFRLHLDTNLGMGWDETWSSFVYEEVAPAAVAKE